MGSSQVCSNQVLRKIIKFVKIAYLGEGTVVPDVPMVGEAVPDKAQSTFFDVLFDRIK